MTKEDLKEIFAMKPPPPRKRRGPHIDERRQSFTASLQLLFNVWSAARGRMAIKKGEAPRQLTKRQFAALLVPEYGETPELILRKLKYLETGR